MSIDFRISRKLANNYVQADVSSKNITRYYKLPENEADSFYQDYKEYDKKTRISATILDITCSLGGAILGISAAKYLKAKMLIQMLVGLTMAFAGNIISTVITARDMQKNENALLEKHHAERIFYDNKINIL